MLLAIRQETVSILANKERDLPSVLARLLSTGRWGALQALEPDRPLTNPDGTTDHD